MSEKAKDGDLRVWWVPQVPMQAFIVHVDSVADGVKIMDVLADYDIFQYENKVKPDYCNVGGLNVFDASDYTDSDEGSWVDWYDYETGEDDPRAFLSMKEDAA